LFAALLWPWFFLFYGFILKGVAMSTNGTLLNHCGARVVDRDALREIETPHSTKTWFPIAHQDVLDCVEDTLDKSGFAIRRSQLSVSNFDQRFFGVLDIESTLAEGVTLSVGVRNSNDKSFPIGFCVGNRTFVCDNLAFSSQIVINKRHTRHGSDRFQEGIANAIVSLTEYRDMEARRIERLQTAKVNDSTAESVILKAWDKRIIGTRMLRPLLDEWREPTFDDFTDRTAWSLLAAFTHVAKPRQRRYPLKAALEVMKFQSLLTS
jgi:hypothetical protein